MSLKSEESPKNFILEGDKSYVEGVSDFWRESRKENIFRHRSIQPERNLSKV